MLKGCEKVDLKIFKHLTRKNSIMYIATFKNPAVERDEKINQTGCNKKSPLKRPQNP